VGNPGDRYLLEALESEGLLRAYLFRYVRNPADVDELLHETYARLLVANPSGGAEVRSVRALALTIARNVALDHLRHRDVVLHARADPRAHGEAQMLRPLLAAITATICIAVAACTDSLLVQRQSQARTWCASSDTAVTPDLRITGCTTVIQSGRETQSNLAIAFNNRGNGYKARGEIDRAIQDYDEAIRLEPDHAKAFLNRGTAYKAKGEIDRAIQDYDEAIRLEPDSNISFFNRGNAWQAKGDYGRAIEDYDEAIRLKPDDAGAFNGRCWTRAIANTTLEAALSDCDESLRLRPDDVGALDSRGFVYFRMRRYDKAIADLDKALSRDPNADSLYVRGLSKRMRHDIAGSDADISAAKTIDPKVAERYAGYGVSP
jgi:tetratricopeptide (TPR) repeat protein